MEGLCMRHHADRHHCLDQALERDSDEASLAWRRRVELSRKVLLNLADQVIELRSGQDEDGLVDVAVVDERLRQIEFPRHLLEGWAKTEQGRC